jgi:hypothetical protein
VRNVNFTAGIALNVKLVFFSLTSILLEFALIALQIVKYATAQQNAKNARIHML